METQSAIHRRPVRAVLVTAALLALLITAAGARAVVKANHDGWPAIDGALIINKLDQSRPIDLRVGADPFSGTDPLYQCDGDHKSQDCFIKLGACAADSRRARMCAAAPVVPANSLKHNELLGGHGDDTIYGGPAGDVIWADYNLPPQPLTQRDKVYGGLGPDFIYASHGYNEIHTGGGSDVVNARYGRGQIYCNSATARVNLSRRSARTYHLHGCKIVTKQAVGTQNY